MSATLSCALCRRERPAAEIDHVELGDESVPVCLDGCGRIPVKPTARRRDFDLDAPEMPWNLGWSPRTQRLGVRG